MSYVSLEKAAKLLLVSQGTILKWIRQGKLRSSKTAQERHIIPRDAVRELLTEKQSSIEEIVNEKRPSLPCWEYNAVDGKIRDECCSCPVFHTRNKKCYQVGKFLKESGKGANCCPTDCEDCSYYREHKRASANPSIPFDSETLKKSPERESN
jgi:excisionase family DNA binding protein